MRFYQLVCLAGVLASVLNADSIVYNNMGELSAGADGVDFVGPLYDSFTSDAEEQITDLQLMLDGDHTSSDAVQVGLFADDLTSPGELIAILGSINDGDLSNMPDMYDVSLEAHPLLTSGAIYWIGLSGTTTAEWGYDYDASGIGVAHEFFSNQMGMFSNDNDPYQMSVTEGESRVPEPPSSLLMASGAALVAIAGWAAGGSIAVGRLWNLT